MAFPSKVVEDLLVACERHCCLCHKPRGVNIEIHHIVPRSKGGDDSAGNAIALCYDCHADVEHYSEHHPRGRKYTPGELKRRRDQHIDYVRSRLGIQPTITLPSTETTIQSAAVLADIDRLELWSPEVKANFLPRVLQIAPTERPAFLEQLGALFDAPSDSVRWNAAFVVEFLVEWEPQLVTDRLLLRLAADEFFSVRSSAAVSYYWLSCCAPERVPVETLRRLASYREDWYVRTPATNALVRLARTRPVAIEALAAELTDQDPDARRHAAEALRTLVRQHPSAARTDIAAKLARGPEAVVKEIAEEWRVILDAGLGASDHSLDSYMF